jgi:hypothetical protein
MNRVILVGRNDNFPSLSGVKPGAGAAAELRQVSRTAATGQGESSAPWWAEAALEVVTVVGGLAVFGAIAFFFMVIG